MQVVGPTGERPLLLLDVDGPLNPWKAKRTPAGYQAYKIDGYPVRLNSDHGRMLTRLNTMFELAWCTTWNESANAEIGPRIGLPILPVLRLERTAPVAARHTPLFWKLGQVLAAVGSRPFAWLDDEISRRERAAIRDRRAFLRFIDPGIGMRQQDLDAVATWGADL